MNVRSNAIRIAAMRPLFSGGTSDKNPTAIAPLTASHALPEARVPRLIMIAAQTGEHCRLNKPDSSRRIIVDQHLMRESPEYRKTGQFGLLEDNQYYCEQRRDDDLCPYGSGQA